MSLELSSVLLVLIGLQVKHVICDGPLQTLRMVQDKSLWPSIGACPCGHSCHGHGGRTGLVRGCRYHRSPCWRQCLMASFTIMWITSKENTVKAMQAGHSTQGPFWWAMTTDQALHHMTYVLLVWLAFKP